MIWAAVTFALVFVALLLLIFQTQRNQRRIEESMRKEERANREEMMNIVKGLNDSIQTSVMNIAKLTDQKMDSLRRTVDEKLGDSFVQVTEKLTLVHKSLGEMQALASGVGDLKKVLMNVKTRGMLGEVQLGNLLEQILPPEYYEKNVATRPKSQDRIEYAVRMPGQGAAETIWLPIDAKFPIEYYERLVDASEKADPQALDQATREFAARIKEEAKSIREKYVDPSTTTEFAIMFLPVESIFAEALRVPGLFAEVQSKYSVILTGPTTLAAILNSLQMGFRTLAIQQRAGEVWELLGAVKAQFSKFGDILEKTLKKLEEAAGTIEDAARKSRTIESKLKRVQTLSGPKAEELLGSVEESEELVR